jgi:putative transposase
MPRRARIVIPDTPHHVTQRGNRRQQTFFRDGDYLRYLQLAAEACARADVACWGYCLMPNHVHLILAPRTREGLRAALTPLHWRYTYEINKRERWKGYFWQGRFASFPMDESYFIQCARYVGLNPVRAGLVTDARDWPWSSVRAHLAETDDALVRTATLKACIGAGVATFFATDVAAEATKRLRAAMKTGRPLGAATWVKALEQREGRVLAARPRGRPPSPGVARAA